MNGDQIRLTTQWHSLDSTPSSIIAAEDPTSRRVETVEGKSKLVVRLPLLSVRTVGVPTMTKPAEVVDIAVGGAFKIGLDGKAVGDAITGAPAVTVGIIHPTPPEPTTIVTVIP